MADEEQKNQRQSANDDGALEIRRQMYIIDGKSMNFDEMVAYQKSKQDRTDAEAEKHRKYLQDYEIDPRKEQAVARAESADGEQPAKPKSQGYHRWTDGEIEEISVVGPEDVPAARADSTPSMKEINTAKPE